MQVYYFTSQFIFAQIKVRWSETRQEKYRLKKSMQHLECDRKIIDFYIILVDWKLQTIYIIPAKKIYVIPVKPSNPNWFHCHEEKENKVEFIQGSQS